MKLDHLSVNKKPPLRWIANFRGGPHEHRFYFARPLLAWLWYYLFAWLRGMVYRLIVNLLFHPLASG